MQFMSDGWIETLWSEFRTATQLQDAAACWVHGPILLLVEADESLQWPHSKGLLIHIHEGEFRAVNATDASFNDRHAPFVLSGSYVHWKQIFSAGSSLVDAILNSKLVLRGDLSLLALNREVLDAVMRIAGETACAFPDDAAVEEPVAAR